MYKNTTSILTGDNVFYSGKESELQENVFRNFFSFIKKGIDAIKNAIKSLVSLEPGKIKRIKIPIDLSLTEASKQVGKKGGEVAEMYLMKEAYDQLTSMGANVMFTENKKVFDFKQFNRDILTKNVNEYKRQEAGTGKNVLNKWIELGEAGGKHLATRISENIDSFKMYDIYFEITGQSETGVSKTDLNVIFKKKNVDEIVEMLRLSLKSTESGTPFDGGHDVGLQTGWKNFIVSLLTGKTSRQLEFQSLSSVEKSIAYAETRLQKAMDRAEKKISKAEANLETASAKTRERRKENLETIKKETEAAIESASQAIDDAKEKYKNTLEYALDEIGKEVGIETSLSTMIDSLINRFKTYGNLGSKSARQDAGNIAVKQDYVDATVEYIKIIETVLAKKFENPTEKQRIVKEILRLGGVEDGLDYLKVGYIKKGRGANKQFIASAASTLGNAKYRETINQLVYGDLDVTVLNNGQSLDLIVTDNQGNKIVKVAIWKAVNNSRIDLPEFPTDDGKFHHILAKFGSL